MQKLLCLNKSHPYFEQNLSCIKPIFSWEISKNHFGLNSSYQLIFTLAVEVSFKRRIQKLKTYIVCKTSAKRI